MTTRMTFTVGFTGTQQGMTEQQKTQLRITLQAYAVGYPEAYHVLRHGDCTGADNEAHWIALSLGYDVIVHPPVNSSKRAWQDAGPHVIVLPPRDYLARNHDIVDACDVLLAAPSTPYERLRSGTWATVRYARKVQAKRYLLVQVFSPY